MTSTRALLRVLTLFNTCRFCLRNACRLGTPSDLHVQALATTMKRAAASDREFHGTPQAKRPASLPVDSFINALSTAGDKEYGDWLNFRVGYTVTKGHQLIIDSKVWRQCQRHWRQRQCTLQIALPSDYNIRSLLQRAHACQPH